VHTEQRAEVTVRYDVERLSEIVSELKKLGAIDGELEVETTSALAHKRHPTPAPGAGKIRGTLTRDC
jgi:hypothetical protein